MSDEELEEPIEIIKTLPFVETTPTPFGKSLIKIAQKVNEVIKHVNKGKKPKAINLKLDLSMNNKTNAFESDVLRWLFNPGIAITRPDTVYLALFTSDPGEVGSVAGEPNGNGYTRISCPFIDPAVGFVYNEIDVAFPASTGAWGNITHVGICKGSVRGVADLMYYGPLVVAANVNAAGLSPRFAAGTLTISEKALFAGISGALQGNASIVGDGTTSGSSPSVYPNLAFTVPTGLNQDGTGTVMDTTFPVVTGTSFAVSNDAQLVAAIAAATWGDEIILQAGATFNDFTWPKKAGWSDGKWILMRSSRLGELPTNPGSFYGLKQAASDNKLFTLNSANKNVLNIHFERGACGLWLAGVRLTNTSVSNHEDALINCYPEPNFYAGNSINNDTNNHVHHIVIDRFYIPEKPTGLRRGIGLNGKFIALLNFHIRGINDFFNNDSQAIAGWAGPGPFKLINGAAEGATENILFGGAGPDIVTEFPADIEIRYVLMYKRAAWEAEISNKSFKNLFEIKDGNRAYLHGCVFLNNFFDSQQNTIIYQSHNEGPASHAPFNFVENIHHRYCKFYNVPTILAISDTGSGPPFPAENGSERIEISHCAQMDPMRLEVSRISFLEVANNLRTMDGIHAHHNLIQSRGIFLYFTDTDLGRVKTSFKFNDNINAAVLAYAFSGSFGPLNEVAFDQFCGAGNWECKNNIVVNGLLSQGTGVLLTAPHNNKDLASVAEIGLVGGSNLRLAPSSPYIGTGTGGSNPGPDWDILDTETAWFQGEPD